MRTPGFLMRLPGHGVNGASVALGIALIDLGLAAAFGPLPALAASTGAICASLADLPLAPDRVWRRVGMAGFVAWAAGTLVAALRQWGVAMGLTTMVLAFWATLALSWGLRAAQLAFVPVLALVFTLAAPPSPDVHQVLVHAAWMALGAGMYFAWAVGTSRLLQPRYRTLALAGALEALASLLRSRAALLALPPAGALPAGPPPLQGWIRGQVTLDDRLQAARDLLFPVAREPHAARAIAVLVQAVEMRDTLLAGELDVELLGHDATAHALREGLRRHGIHVADGIDEMARALRLHGLADAGSALQERAEPAFPVEGPGGLGGVPVFAPSDPRFPLAIALRNRMRQFIEVLGRMQAALRGESVSMPLAVSELQAFISPEGWPLAALRAQLSLDSPVFRHAVRLSIALGSAYFLGLVLPWASHPHWLVLSVAVVMRGNLEQTLSRRNDRVLGTLIGCLLVLVLAHFAAPWVATMAFLAAVGIAHSYASARYLVTSAAASVMALMQAHLAQPDAGFGAAERLGDTLLGAALAWGFSYLWPWWERRGLARLTQRVLKSLGSLSAEVLRLPDPAVPDLPLRLARRDVYEAVGAVASAAQRTAAEPERVRVPMYAMSEMLTRCHVLMAQLLSVRLLLMRRGRQLDAAEASAALYRAREAVLAALAPEAGAGRTMPVVDIREGEGDIITAHATSASAVPGEDVDHAAIPAALPDSALQPWLERRLHLATRAAQRVGLAARALREFG